jgi:hypothetical protein
VPLEKLEPLERPERLEHPERLRQHQKKSRRGISGYILAKRIYPKSMEAEVDYEIKVIKLQIDSTEKRGRNLKRITWIWRPYCLDDSGVAFWRSQEMEKPIKILHIDPDWKVILFYIQNGVTIKSFVPLEPAISMLKNIKFDLILSEPQNIAILTPQTKTNELDYFSNCQLK